MGRVDERDVADIHYRRPVILLQLYLSRAEKPQVIVVDLVETNIPTCTLNARRIAAEVNSFQSPYAPREQPTSKIPTINAGQLISGTEELKPFSP